MTDDPRRSPAQALARAVALADMRAATTGLGPIGRWRVKRVLKLAACELGFELPPAGTQHIADRDAVGATVALLQTAWLRLHNVILPPSLSGREAIHARYWTEASAPPTRPRRGLAIVIAAVVLVGGGVAFALTRPSDGPAWQPPIAATRMGHLDATQEAQWVEAITDWVVALDRLSRARFDGELPTKIAEHEDTLARHRKGVIADEIRALFSDAVVDAVALMLDGAEAASSGRSGWAEREEVFANAVRTTNRALAERGFGYFFDSYAVRYEDGRAEAALYTFRVATRRRLIANGVPVDAYHLRRLDQLNIVQSLLGYTSRRMDVAVLLVDKLEGEIATRLGPALEPGTEMPLHMDGDDEGKTAWLEVRSKAGQAVRESFYGAMPGEQQALSELGTLLARRTALVADWNERLERRDVTLRDFEALAVEPERRERFENYTSAEARGVLDAIQRDLETPENNKLFERLVARHAQPVELHEVQHRIDYAAGDDFEVPAQLLRILQVPPGSKHAESEDVRRVAYELSAYTAELARDPEWARVNLTLLCEHLYDASGGAEGWSAVLILEGLGRELGLTFTPIIDPDGRKAGADLETVAALHLQLLGKHGTALAKAASSLWEQWYGHPLVPLSAAP